MALVGRCKWFNDDLGYGFATVMGASPLAFKDVFVHHTELVTTSPSVFRRLFTGEYVQFDARPSKRGLQACGVTGVLGGPLMCETMHASARPDARPVAQPDARPDERPVAQPDAQLSSPRPDPAP